MTWQRKGQGPDHGKAKVKTKARTNVRPMSRPMKGLGQDQGKLKVELKAKTNERPMTRPRLNTNDILCSRTRPISWNCQVMEWPRSVSRPIPRRPRKGQGINQGQDLRKAKFKTKEKFQVKNRMKEKIKESPWSR